MTYMRTRFGPSAFTHPLVHSRPGRSWRNGPQSKSAGNRSRTCAADKLMDRHCPLAALGACLHDQPGITASGAETLPGVPRRCTYTVVVGPWCEGYWRRIGPYRPSHASRYSACLPPSCSPPFASSERPVGNGDNTPNKREGSRSGPTPPTKALMSGCDASKTCVEGHVQRRVACGLPSTTCAKALSTAG